MSYCNYLVWITLYNVPSILRRYLLFLPKDGTNVSKALGTTESRFFRQSWPTTLQDSNGFEGRKDKRVKWRANIRIMVSIRLHAWNSRCAYTPHCGGSGTLRKYAHPHSHTEGVHVRNSTALHPSRYTYGQVEPLVLLNQITSEVAEDRYFRVSFPGNRPRDSAASAYFICVREPTPFTTLSVHSSVRSSAPCPAVLPRLVFLRCNTTCTNKTALFDPIPLLLSPFRLVWFLSVLGTMKTEMFLVIACCNDTWEIFKRLGV